MTKSKGIIAYQPRHFWSDDELAYLREHFEHNLTIDIATALSLSLSRIRNKAHALGLKKSKTLKQATGRMSSSHPNVQRNKFYKGQVPPNKGQQMTDAVREKVKHTFFLKGHQPHNTRTEGDGALSKRKEYWWIRLELSKWRQLHTYTWEAANRPINPKTEMVVFKDGNKDNCQLDNLEMITRAENMRRNTIQRYPVALRMTIRTLNQLNSTIAKHEE